MQGIIPPEDGFVFLYIGSSIRLVTNLFVRNFKLKKQSICILLFVLIQTGSVLLKHARLGYESHWQYKRRYYWFQWRCQNHRFLSKRKSSILGNNLVASSLCSKADGIEYGCRRFYAYFTENHLLASIHIARLCAYSSIL